MEEKILVVEDDKSIRDLIAFNLKEEGYSVLESANGKEAFQLLKKEKIDFVILDWMIPGGTGLEVCRWIRQDAELRLLPVIILTARETEIDKIVGLELGADDYMTKPFSSRELVARIKSVLRRTRLQENILQDEWPKGPLVVKKEAHQVFLEGQEVGLTRKEYDLLLLLYTYSDRVYSRQELLEKVWGFDYFGDSRTVDVHVQRLRAKLGIVPEVAEAAAGRASSGLCGPLRFGPQHCG